MDYMDLDLSGALVSLPKMKKAELVAMCGSCVQVISDMRSEYAALEKEYSELLEYKNTLRDRLRSGGDSLS